MNRAHTTISKELKRCGTKFEYSPSKAHKKARAKDCLRGREQIVDSRAEVLQEVLKKLGQIHSLQQISVSIKNESPDDPKKWISHESIYKYIYPPPRGELRKLFTSFLRSKRKLRKDRSHIHSRRGGIPDATPIRKRPKEVESREVPGHWEGDLIIGKNHKSALGTLVERTTRYLILNPFQEKKMPNL